MGLIYYIRCKVNNKYYIGQTSKTIERRMKQHISDWRKGKITKLYNAFSEYGISNFEYETILECNDNALDDNEIKYIKHFDSYRNGYNMGLGGRGWRRYALDSKEVIENYNINNSVTKVAEIYKCDRSVIAEILRNEGINTYTTENKSKEVYMMGSNGEVRNQFESIMSAYKWLLQNHNDKITCASAYHYIALSCRTGRTAFGYKWNYEPSLVKAKEIYKPSNTEIIRLVESGISKNKLAEELGVSNVTLGKWYKQALRNK